MRPIIRPTRRNSFRRMRSFLLLAGLLSTVCAVAAQTGAVRADSLNPIFAWGEADVLIAEYVDHNTRVDAPPLPPELWHRGAQPTQFVITIEDEVPEATAAIHAAADIWSTHVKSSVPVKVRVRWVSLGENVLGTAGPRLIANFTQALEPNTWFPTALASALENRDLNPDQPDIEMQFNSNFARWYFGVDGNPPQNRFDFLSVVLHEIGHGLGFVGSMRVENEVGRWGFATGEGATTFPVVYDRFAETDFQGVTSRLVDTSRFPNPSAPLAQALQSEEVYFHGPVSVAANVESQIAQGLAVPAGGRPKLHAPPEWLPGSSYSHLTEQRVGDEEPFYPPGSLNSLMTPRLGATEVIRTPGPVTCGMFRDMGWPLGPHCEAMLPEPPPLPDESIVVVGPCPNPAVAGRTEVQVYVNEQARVRADLYDLLGRRVGRFADRLIHASGVPVIGDEPRCIPGGLGSIQLDLTGLASGLYILRVFTPAAEQSVKVINVR
jgi:hypothetical protein